MFHLLGILKTGPTALVPFEGSPRKRSQRPSCKVLAGTYAVSIPYPDRSTVPSGALPEAPPDAVGPRWAPMPSRFVWSGVGRPLPEGRSGLTPTHRPGGSTGRSTRHSHSRGPVLGGWRARDVGEGTPFPSAEVDSKVDDVDWELT